MNSNLALRKLAAWLRKFWLSWRWYVLFLLGVWIPVRSVIADYNPVPTGSMNPTILEGDVVYVNKLAYELRVPLSLQRIARWEEPARGDIVVLLSPVDRQRLVKRVIGLPGDTIEMRNRQLVINGETIEYEPPRESYGAAVPQRWRPHAVFAEEQLGDHEHAVMALPAWSGAPRDFELVRVPVGKLFVMGDNRDNSADSRAFGFVDRQAVLGRVEGVIVSWDIIDRWLPRMGRWLTKLR